MRLSGTPDSVWCGRPRPQTASGTTAPKALIPDLYRHIVVSLLIALTTAAAAPAQRAAFAPPAHAVAPTHAGRSFNSRHSNFIVGRNPYSSGFRRSTYAPYVSLPFPFFDDSFNPDDIYSTGYPVASQVPPYLLEAARAMRAPSSLRSLEGQGGDSATGGDPSSSQPLMIELQNGRYVRVNPIAANGDTNELPTAAPFSSPPNTASPNSARIHAARPAISIAPATTIAAAPTRDLPPAVLIFRDGQSEEVRDYTIADGFLYIRGDFYKDGFWTKKIAVSTLDLSQTLQTNESHNVKFILPSSPNEVITRP